MGPRARRVPQITAVLLTSATLFALSGCADGAANSAGVWVRVSPGSVNAGSQVQITAVCEQSVSSATVTSTAFGTATVQASASVMAATVTIPAGTPKGAFDVRLTCPSGSMASTTLMVSAMVAQAQAQAQAQVQAQVSSAPGPNTGGGFLAHGGANGEENPPADRTPLAWLSVGLASLVAATALAIRRKRRRPAAALSGLEAQEQDDRIDERRPAAG